MNQKYKLLLYFLLTVINPALDVTFPPGSPVTILNFRAILLKYMLWPTISSVCSDRSREILLSF